MRPRHPLHRPLPAGRLTVTPADPGPPIHTFECPLPDGTLTYSDTGGDNPVLLLLHGAYLSHQAWRPQIDALREHYRVIAPDLRAHGSSTRAGQPYSIALFAQDLQRLLSTLGLERVAVCGHSLGGMVALELTLQAPASVAALVLAETSYGTSSTRLEAWTTRWIRPLFSVTRVRWQAELFARSLARGNPELHRYVFREVLTYEHDPGTYLAIWDAVTAFDRAASLGRIQVPALVLAGARNRPTHAQARTFVKEMQDAELVMIPGAGHLVNLDQAQAFNAALVEFLQAARTRREGSGGETSDGSRHSLP